MKPNQTVRLIRPTWFVPEQDSLVACYLPIVGIKAFALYQYLLTFGKHIRADYRISEILNHLNMGLRDLEDALIQLQGMELLSIYQLEEGYEWMLQAPLSVPDFLGQPVLKALLATKIGEAACEALQQSEQPKGELQPRGFAEVYGHAATPFLQAKKPRVNEEFEAFPILPFKEQMARQGLSFADEASDTLALYQLSKDFQVEWTKLLQLGKETAVHAQLSVKRMRAALEGNQQKTGTLTRREQSVVAGCKSRTPLEFLTFLKESRQALVTEGDRKLVRQLERLGLLDEVINVVLLYTYNKMDSANLNERYAIKVANDMSYKGIQTAEAAVLSLREGARSQSKSSSRSQAVRSSNVPEWSKDQGKQTKTEDGQAKLEELRRQLLEKEQKGGN